MRRLGKITQEDDVERFQAFAAAEGLSVHVDHDTSSDLETECWVVWGRDEDQLAITRQALDDFLADPLNPRYAAAWERLQADQPPQAGVAERTAEEQAEARRRRRTTGRTPLVSSVIALCVVVFVLSGFGGNPTSAARRSLGFCDTKQLPSWQESSPSDRLVDVSRGQVWRVITPIFLHGDAIHLLFNMFMFSFFGSMIERVRGPWYLFVLVILVAIASNLAQGLFPDSWGPLAGSPFFVGISGVVYGLFGYVWLKSSYKPEAGYDLAPGIAIVLLVFMAIGLSGILDEPTVTAASTAPRIANVSHVAGLAMGMLIAAITQFRSLLSST